MAFYPGTGSAIGSPVKRNVVNEDDHQSSDQQSAENELGSGRSAAAAGGLQLPDIVRQLMHIFGGEMIERSADGVRRTAEGGQTVRDFVQLDR